MLYLPAIPTNALGSPGLHDLKHKLDEAANHGFKGVEIFYEDLESYSKTLNAVSADDNRLEAARQIRQWCDDLGLVIIGLQPFMHYEGLVDREEHERRINKLRLWLRLVKILRTTVILVPTNFMKEGTTGNRDVLVRDMIEIAELGLREEPVVRFAYENLCWGTHIDTWHGVWDVILRVNRPNFGICLDTFNIAGREWADPAAPSGKIPNADQTLHNSLKKLKESVDVSKIFYVQVVDAKKLDRPLVRGHSLYNENQPARMSWSRASRLFTTEDGGYLPVVEILKAITEEDGLGYKGWISFELFNRSLSNESEEVPESHAERAWKAWNHLEEEMGWNEN